MNNQNLELLNYRYITKEDKINLISKKFTTITTPKGKDYNTNEGFKNEKSLL